MRTITLLCALLLLAACGPEPPKAPEPKKGADAHTTSTNDDSSPIIIADGSIHIRHGKPGRNHFKDTGARSASIKEKNYHPEVLWYQCDPTPNAPAAVACPAETTNPADCDPLPKLPKAGCRVPKLNTSQKWTLALCEQAATCPTVDMAWPGTTGGNSDPEKMTIATQAPDLNYVAASPTAGAEAVHGGPDNHLQSATLEVTKAGSKATYQFACIPNPGEICLAIDYHCRVNDSSCLPDPAK